MRAAEALAAGAVAALALATPVAGPGAAATPAALVAGLVVLLDAGRADEAAVALVIDGADLSWRDAAMRTPLHRAASVSGDGRLIRAMAERGAALEARDAEGRTPLHLAARNPAVAVSAALVAAGARTSPADAAGRTPLHEAGDAGLGAVAGLLVLVGADPCATDAAGRPALDAGLLDRLRTEAPESYPAAVEAFLSCF